jgi:hypothetical protein
MLILQTPTYLIHFKIYQNIESLKTWELTFMERTHEKQICNN